MTSAYQLLCSALLNRQSCFAVYDGYDRHFCPHIIGLKDGVEQALCWQFAGESSNPLPPGGRLKCLTISKMSGLVITREPWHDGEPGKTGRPSFCVDAVDQSVSL
jgi:hypothetical protein